MLPWLVSVPPRCRSKLEGRALVLRLTRLVLFKAQSGSSGLKATEHTT